jgi:hypothetical protein
VVGRVCASAHNTGNFNFSHIVIIDEEILYELKSLQLIKKQFKEKAS